VHLNLDDYQTVKIQLKRLCAMHLMYFCLESVQVCPISQVRRLSIQQASPCMASPAPLLILLVLILGLAATSTQACKLIVTTSQGNVARDCVQKYWNSPQAQDSFGCLKQKISCVDIVMSGATTSSIDSASITNQDYYNLVHGAILSGGSPVNAFGFNFDFATSIPRAVVSTVDNVLSGAEVAFVSSENPAVNIGGFINKVPVTATITTNTIGPFPAGGDGGQLKNKKGGGDNCVFFSSVDATPPNVGASTFLTVRASALKSGGKQCGVIGILGSVAGAVTASPLPGIVAAVGSVACNQ
jgi:hypothetical protein